MPGSNARALEKARTLAADVLVMDLEDAVAPEMKLEARGQVAAAIKAGGYGHREIAVRVNALSTPWAATTSRQPRMLVPTLFSCPRSNRRKS
jgi:citrate lyase subunit beta/citryl-CoA lyase